MAIVGSHRFFIVRIVQTVIGAMLVPMTYLLGKKFTRENEKVARLSAWIIALYPMLVIYPLALATENILFYLVIGS
jgi:4-amino-4-deoxy-L-arabinose transferase-like glycosyltransferase